MNELLAVLQRIEQRLVRIEALLLGDDEPVATDLDGGEAGSPREPGTPL